MATRLCSLQQLNKEGKNEREYVRFFFLYRGKFLSGIITFL
ncbi:hypothetical protein BC059799_3423 [Bacillus cereus NVH0597-99]|nr:hypothetical protein BC059799_3423 [Bacillus cereus NVH0597-99]